MSDDLTIRIAVRGLNYTVRQELERWRGGIERAKESDDPRAPIVLALFENLENACELVKSAAELPVAVMDTPWFLEHFKLLGRNNALARRLLQLSVSGGAVGDA